MEFKEVFVEQFTSPTTCYSGAQGWIPPNRVGLAIETHSLHAHYVKADETQSLLPTLDIHSRKFHKKKLKSLIAGVCVGYSNLNHEDGLYEAFVMVLDEQHVDHANKNSASASSSLDVLVEDGAHHQSSSSIHSEQLDTTALNTPKAWLVLRQTSLKSTSAVSTRSRECSVALSYRPLSPKLVKLALSNPDSSDDTSSFLLGIWVGSADDAQIRFYVPSDKDDSTLVLVKVVAGDTSTQASASDSVPFRLESPVMAIDFCHTHECIPPNHVAVACQDGTIQIVDFQCTVKESRLALQLYNINVYNTCVDGPIVSLCIHETNHTSLCVVVGSLCGFVCQIRQETNSATKDSTTWQEPTMLVENLWNDALKAPDSVLTLHVWNGFIAVGTLSGKVTLLQQKDNQEYHVTWQRQLPYPIHGICVLEDNQRLVVTTKWTIHLFGRIVVSYNAELAKRRVLHLMSQRNIASPRQAILDKDATQQESDHGGTTNESG